MIFRLDNLHNYQKLKLLFNKVLQKMQEQVKKQLKNSQYKFRHNKLIISTIEKQVFKANFSLLMDINWILQLF